MLRAFGSKAPPLRRIEDAFEDGRMKAEYETEDVYAWFQNRHSKGLRLIDEDGYLRRNGCEWRVPYGVREALRTNLHLQQVIHKDPFFVTWVSPKTGKRLRRSFGSIPHAMLFVTEQAQHVDPQATIVAKHGFYIPRKLMGKFPRPWGPDNALHYWCPRCMQPRRFKRNGQVFWTQKKFPDPRGGYKWKEVRLAVICCVVCGISNRDHHFRASNQPVEIRRFKKGARRATRKKRRRSA